MCIYWNWFSRKPPWLRFWRYLKYLFAVFEAKFGSRSPVADELNCRMARWANDNVIGYHCVEPYTMATFLPIDRLINLSNIQMMVFWRRQVRCLLSVKCWHRWCFGIFHDMQAVRPFRLISVQYLRRYFVIRIILPEPPTGRDTSTSASKCEIVRAGHLLSMKY